VNCPRGKIPLGGGVYAGLNGVRLIESSPLGTPSNPTGWRGIVFNGDTSLSPFDVWAICAAVNRDTGYEEIGSTNQQVAAGGTGSVTVNCPAGKKPLGGGVTAGSTGIRLIESFPLSAPSNPSGWRGSVFNGGTVSSTFAVYAICASV
jgi:hypothetical protein